VTVGRSEEMGVVVGVDGSEPSLRALRWAAFLARRMHVNLTAVIIWEPMGLNSWGTEGWAAFPSDWNPEANAQSALDRAIAAAFGSAPPAELNTAVIDGTPARALLAASAEAICEPIKPAPPVTSDGMAAQSTHWRSRNPRTLHLLARSRAVGIWVD